MCIGNEDSNVSHCLTFSPSSLISFPPLTTRGLFEDSSLLRRLKREFSQVLKRLGVGGRGWSKSESTTEERNPGDQQSRTVNFQNLALIFSLANS
jgi:hypothetical protein